MFAAVDPIALLGVFGVVLGVAVTVGVAIAVARTNTTKASVEIMVLRNSEMRQENIDLRAEIGVLRGKVDLLTSGLAKDLAHEFRAEIQEMVKELKAS